MDKEFIEKLLNGFGNSADQLEALKTVLKNTDCRHKWGEMKFEEPRTAMSNVSEDHVVAEGFHYQRCKDCRKIEKVK